MAFDFGGKLAVAAGVVVAFAGAQAPAQGASVFINEIHYDNAGADTGEFFEVAGPAGTDLSTWLVQLYNGSNGSVYDEITLTGVLMDQQNGFGTLSFALPAGGLQNGAPDGLALYNPSGALEQFLSYEGSLLATEGGAIGQTSIDIGVAESAATPVGFSLQLMGTGSDLSDFTWTAAAAETPGSINNGQSFQADSTAVPTPALLPGLVGFGLSLLRKRREQSAELA